MKCGLRSQLQSRLGVHTKDRIVEYCRYDVGVGVSKNQGPNVDPKP